MSSYAKLHAELIGESTLQIRNYGSQPARKLDIRLTDTTTGRGWNLLLEAQSTFTVRPQETIAMHLDAAHGPAELELTLHWVDDAGIPGMWFGPIVRQQL